VKIGMEFKERDIYEIVEILNSHLKEEVGVGDLLIQALMKKINSSDIVFLLLQILEEKGYIKGKKGSFLVNKEISDEEAKEIAKIISGKILKSKKIFVTPLEVAKFFQCPRRLFLEKVVLAKQEKEEKGKTWDGEAVHYAVNFFVKNLSSMQPKYLIEEAAKKAMEKFAGKITISKESLVDFLERFYSLIKKEGFSYILMERKFESLKAGIVGTPDIVGIKNEEIIPIDIKLAEIKGERIKEEHLLQSVGESILVENFFRRKVNFSYLIYFSSKSLVKIRVTEKLKRKFLNYKKEIERMCKIGRIPEKGKLPNMEKRVCLGCHVRQSCENMEALRSPF